MRNSPWSTTLPLTTSNDPATLASNDSLAESLSSASIPSAPVDLHNPEGEGFAVWCR